MNVLIGLGTPVYVIQGGIRIPSSLNWICTISVHASHYESFSSFQDGIYVRVNLYCTGIFLPLIVGAVFIARDILGIAALVGCCTVQACLSRNSFGRIIEWRAYKDILAQVNSELSCEVTVKVVVRSSILPPSEVARSTFTKAFISSVVTASAGMLLIP